MKRNLLDHHHARGRSPVHHLPAEMKLGAALGLLIITVMLPPPATLWQITLALLLALVIGLSRIPPLFFLQRLLLLSPFLLGVAVLHWANPASRLHLPALLARSLLCLLTVLITSNTTPFSEVLRVLRRARVPALLITTLALMHRYLFVLAEEAGRMSRARASRTFGRPRRPRWHALAAVIGQLFVRASERAERIYAAMCARGWS